MSQVLTGDVMPDMDHAHEGLQQSLGMLGGLLGGKEGLPVACCSAGAGLGCSWDNKGTQERYKGNSGKVSHGE